MKLNIKIIILVISFILIYIYYSDNILIQEFFNNEYSSSNNELINIAKSKIESIDTLDNDKIIKYFSDIPYNIYNKSMIKSNNKILVSIASYRDSQCSVTLSDVISKAKYPENLVVIVCQQNDINDSNCIQDNNFLINTKATIKQIIIPHTEARGPCWARFLIQQEWSGEEYYLQVDSHTKFVDGWDEKCIECLKQCSEDGLKVCLTNYVSTFNINTGEIEGNPLRGPMYIESLDQTDGFFRYNSKYEEKKHNQPQESKGWSGCFSFSSSQILIDAPYDPYTPFLFFGEETDIFARLYTRGWKMYVPHIPICFTVFDRSYRKTFWEHPDQAEIVELSKIRLYLRFGLIDEENINLDIIKKDINKFNLGNKKTFNDFLNYCN
jgi:[Skp1-protein]-hydroxyproline N-acetylglucosaminyltransferase